MINFNMPKETLMYLGGGAVVLGLWLLAYVAGIHEGAQQSRKAHELQIAECTIENERAQAQVIDAQLELTKCKSLQAGKCALNCEAIAQERVDAVLQDFTKVVCND